MEKFLHEKKHFNANQIQKYFRNQPAASPNTNSNTKYTDEFFPPTAASILSLKKKQNSETELIEGSNGNSSINIQNIQFKRIDEIASGYEVFQDQIEFSDINQRGLGHCYFMCAIAALAENPILISRLFRTKTKNVSGYYEIVLFIDGEWQVVIVDDFFVVHKNCELYENPFVFSSPNGKEMWVLILEKAWAKVNGGFTNIISGQASDAMLALTGFNSEFIYYSRTNIDEVWEKLLDADQHNYFIACNTSTEIDGLREATGIVESHAFSMVSVIEGEFAGERLRLVKIRNPWGFEEWKGDYSDYDEVNWSEEKSKFFGFTRNNKDGIFFMKIEDHVKFFHNSCVCRMFYNPFFFNYNIPKSEIEQPHVFNLVVDQEDGMLINISVMFWHWRFNRDHAIDRNETEYPTSVVVAKYDENLNFFETCGKFNSLGNLDYNVKLSKGRYAVWVYCNYEACCEPKPETFYVRFLSERHFYVKKSENLDKFFALVKKMIIAGIKEECGSQLQEYAKNNCNYYFTKNEFKNTGLGYFFIKKKPQASHVCVNYDASKIQGFDLLPPKKTEAKGKLYTDDEEIILSLKMKSFATFWMNMEYDVEDFFEPENVITGMKRDITKFLSLEKVEDLKLSAKANSDTPNKSIEEKNKILINKQMSIKKETENNEIVNEEPAVPVKVSKHEKLLKLIENLFVSPKGAKVLNYSRIRLCHLLTKKLLTVPVEHVKENTIKVEVCVKEINNFKTTDDCLFTIICNNNRKNDNQIRNGDSNVCLALDKIDRYLFFDNRQKSKISKQTDVHLKKYIHDDAGFLFKVQIVYSPYEDNVLRVGSIIKFVNGKKIALHSHLEFIPGTANEEQEVTGFEGNDENDYWTIVETI